MLIFTTSNDSTEHKREAFRFLLTRKHKLHIAPSKKNGIRYYTLLKPKIFPSQNYLRNQTLESSIRYHHHLYLTLITLQDKYW